MAKSPESNGWHRGLPATLSLLHPGDFPVGSVESRAAARAMLGPGQLRAGDQGDTEDGGWYIVLKGKGDDPENPRALVITSPCCMSSLLPNGEHPDGCKTTPAQRAAAQKPDRLCAPKSAQTIEAERQQRSNHEVNACDGWSSRFG